MMVAGFDPETYGLQNSRLTAELPKPSTNTGAGNMEPLRTFI